MNPSVRDLMDAIDRTSADTVYVLPNNKNIVPAAKQAAEQSTKAVHVIETVSHSPRNRCALRLQLRRQG